MIFSRATNLRSLWILAVPLIAAPASFAETAETNTRPVGARPAIYQLDPPSPRHESAPTTQTQPATAVIPADDLISSPVFSSSIFALPADIPATPDLATRQAELTLLRERADRADQLFRQGEAEKAIHLMLDSRNLTANPKFQAKLLNRLALYSFRMQQYSNALAYANEASDLAPDDLGSQCNLAAALLTIGETASAIEILQRVVPHLSLAPRFAFVTYFNLACAYSLQQGEEKAFHYLRRAAHADPRATLASLGDPQLDTIRDRSDVQKLRDELLRQTTPETRSPSP